MTDICIAQSTHRKIKSTEYDEDTGMQRSIRQTKLFAKCKYYNS